MLYFLILTTILSLTIVVFFLKKVKILIDLKEKKLKITVIFLGFKFVYPQEEKIRNG